MTRIPSESEKLALQNVILPVIATGTDGSFRPIGSCWIFAASGRDALAFSAAHIFDEVVRSEGRHERAAVTMPDILRPLKSKPISLASTRLKALYRHTIDQTLCVDIQQIYRNGSTDVAVCQLTFQDDAPSHCAFAQKMGIHAGPVRQSTDVAAVGYAGMERSRSQVSTEVGLAWAVHYHQLTIEHGKCLDYYGRRGPRGLAGPCFEIDVRTQHGMSGGPILHKAYGDSVVGCGVVSCGTAFGAGETTMASALWPAYSFNIETLRDDRDLPLTLLDLARHGWIDDKSDGPTHFRTIRAVDEHGGTIAWI